jgi:hypothetical protein
MSQGNSRANGISDRESNSQANCEDHRDFGHGGVERYSLFAYQTACSKQAATASRKEKKTTAGQDQARQVRREVRADKRQRTRERERAQSHTLRDPLLSG